MAAASASRYVSRASSGSSGSSRVAALEQQSAGVAPAPLLECDLRRAAASTRPRSSSSSAPGLDRPPAGRARRRERRRRAWRRPPRAGAAHGAPARVSARRRARGKRRRPRSPPRACARPAERSSSAATSSSGIDAACARCQARRSGSISRIGCLRQGAMGCAALRSARLPGRRPSGPADDGTPLATPSSSKPSDFDGRRATDSGIPSCCAARHRSAGSPTGPPPRAAASAAHRAGSRARRRVKLSSMLADNGTAAGSPNPPASWAGVSPRGSSSSASGLPRVSRTIRSSTCSSSRAGKDRLQQRPRIAMAEGLDAELRQSGERARPPPASRTRTRSSRPAGGGRRTRARAPTRGRATGRRRRRTAAAAPRRPRTAGRGWPARPGSGFGACPALSPKATPSASRWGSGRCSVGRGSASRAVAAPRKGAPSPPRPRQPAAREAARPSSTVQSSSAVLPTPGSPCTTRTPPSPLARSHRAGGRAPPARAAGRAVGLPGAACASERVTANPSRRPA